MYPPYKYRPEEAQSVTAISYLPDGPGKANTPSPLSMSGLLPSALFSTDKYIFSRVSGACILLTVILLGACGGKATPADQQEQQLIDHALRFQPEGNPRRIDLQGAKNFRELGGYQSAQKKGGRILRSGLLFRSGELSALKPKDLDKLRELGIRRVVDFRTAPEKEQAPSRLPTDIEIMELPMGGDVYQEVRGVFEGSEQEQKDFDGREFMQQLNRVLIREYTPQFSRWLHSLIEEENALPQVFHCTAGKDRTGLATALLMHILQIPLQTIQGDYLLSKTYGMKDEAKQMGRIQMLTKLRGPDPEKIRPLLTVEKEFLDAAFAQITEQYGNINKYIRNGLKISPQERRQLIEKLTRPSS